MLANKMSLFTYLAAAHILFFPARVAYSFGHISSSPFACIVPDAWVLFTSDSPGLTNANRAHCPDRVTS